MRLAKAAQTQAARMQRAADTRCRACDCRLFVLGFLVVASAAAQTPQRPPAAAGNMIRRRMQAVAAQPDTPGIGPYAALKEMAPNGLDFTIYRPRDLNALGGRKLGVHVWGNGGCSFDGGFARFHLMDIASYGYVSLAHGRLQDGPGGLPAPGAPRATAEGMLAALDWILAENSRQGSPYYQRIDASKIAVSGNSCGGLLALRVGQDSRVKTVILQNSGIIPAGANNAGLGGLTKADLAKLHTPVLYCSAGQTISLSPTAWMISSASIMSRSSLQTRRTPGTSACSSSQTDGGRKSRSTG